MTRREYPHGLVVEDRLPSADWRSGCLVLLAVFLLAFVFGLSIGLAATRPAEPTAAPEVRASDGGGGNGPVAVAMTPRETPRASASALLASSRPRPTPRQVARMLLDRVGATETGVASHMGTSAHFGYLALPAGPGQRVAIRGPIGCVERVSTDAGPDLAMQRRGRIADLYVGDFEKVCGPRWLGVCKVSVTYGGSCGPDD